MDQPEERVIDNSLDHNDHAGKNDLARAPKPKALEVDPNKGKYLARLESILKSNEQEMVKLVRDRMGETKEDRVCADILTHTDWIKSMVTGCFKKFTKTVYDVGPCTKNSDEKGGRQIDPCENEDNDELSGEERSELEEVVKKNQLKFESILLNIKRLNSQNNSMQGEVARQVQPMYDIMFKKIDADRRVNSDDREMASLSLSRMSKDMMDATRGKNKQERIDFRLDSHIKDLTTMHNVKAKLTISTVNTMVNDLMGDVDVMMKRYMILKNKIVKQDSYLRAGFDQMEDYERILEE